MRTGSRAKAQGPQSNVGVLGLGWGPRPAHWGGPTSEQFLWSFHRVCAGYVDMTTSYFRKGKVLLSSLQADTHVSSYGLLRELGRSSCFCEGLLSTFYQT